MIYLDNAATTMRKPREVIEAVIHAMETAGNAARGMGEAALWSSRFIFEARMQVADLFNVKRPDHVIFTSNATEALNIALNGLFKKGDHVITTALEHNAVLRPLYRLEKRGDIALSVVPADSYGNIDIDAFETEIRPSTRAIVVTHASNLTGNVVDVRRIGRLARARGILFIVDAAQTAGSVPIDMENFAIDVLCVTGHKGLFGPQGTGCLCLREGVDIRPFKVGGTGVQSFSKTQPETYPERLEAGTLNTHGIAGLVAGINFIRSVGIEKIHRHEMYLTRRFYDGVISIPDIQIYGDFSADDRAPIVALNLDDIDSAIVADMLSTSYGIATRAGAHCAPRMHEALGTASQGVVRFSFSWFNTETEIDRAIAALHDISRQLAFGAQD
ncbi:MAG: aminotransferase class V-fold PLP-dependent enzyme [Saccharofermentanales bacterium]|jgi:cysteine desulfurase family protein